MDIKRSGSKRSGFNSTRRELLKRTAATGGALAAGRLLPGATPPAAAQTVNTMAAQGSNAAAAPVNVVLRVNGAEHRRDVRKAHHALHA